MRLCDQFNWNSSICVFLFLSLLFANNRKRPWNPPTPVWRWWWNPANTAWVTNKRWRRCAKAKPNWSSSPTTLHPWGKWPNWLLRSSVFYLPRNKKWSLLIEWKKFEIRNHADSIWNHMELRLCDWEVCFQCKSNELGRQHTYTKPKHFLSIRFVAKCRPKSFTNAHVVYDDYTTKTYGVVIFDSLLPSHFQIIASKLRMV